MPPRKPKATPAAEEPLARLPGMIPAGVSTPIAAPVPTATEERRERDLEELLEAVGTDGRLRVWHVIEGKAVYAGEMTLDGFSLDTLLDTFGGGDKSLVFYQGRTKVETLRVSLDPSMPPRNPRAGKGNAAAPGAPGNSVTDIASVLASMATMNMQSMQASQQMMTGMVTAVTTLLAAKPERDPMDTALKMAELLKRDGGAGNASELFSIFEKGMNVASKLNGGEDDGTLGLAREGLGIVAKIIENNKAAPVAVVPPPRALGAGHGAAIRGVQPSGNSGTGVARASVESGAGEQGGGNATENPDTTGGEMGNGVNIDRNRSAWVEAARPSLPLFSLAIGNVSPDTAANMIADRLSDDEFASLIEDIESGTPGEFLTRFQAYFDIRIPGDETYRWCLELVQSLKALVEDDEPGETLTETENGAN